jgi:hypothetical protein
MYFGHHCGQAPWVLSVLQVTRNTMSGKRNYIRKTGIESVRGVLKNLPEHHKHPRDAIRMIDRTIGGLLAHIESPSYHAYRDYASTIFPAGLEATLPGKDIILILNSAETTVIKNGHEQIICIPRALKNPEKGVAQIIGQHFARTLFIARGRVLAQLIETEKNGDIWQVNATANEQALKVLKDYIPYQSIFDKPSSNNNSWLEQLCPCFTRR